MLDTRGNILYKCINIEELLLSVSILTYVIKIENKTKQLRKHHYVINILSETKTWQFMQLSENSLRRQGQND